MTTTFEKAILRWRDAIEDRLCDLTDVGRNEEVEALLVNLESIDEEAAEYWDGVFPRSLEDIDPELYVMVLNHTDPFLVKRADLEVFLSDKEKANDLREPLGWESHEADAYILETFPMVVFEEMDMRWVPEDLVDDFRANTFHFELVTDGYEDLIPGKDIWILEH